MGQSPNGNTYNQNGEGVALINGPTEFTEKYPVKVQWTTSPTKICKEGDILLCVRGSSTGRLNIANEEYCVGRGVAAIRAKKNSNHSFLNFQVENIVSKILALTTGSTFPNIDSKSLRGIKVSLPSLPEQKSIAHILSLMDAAINSCNSLIAKKELQKKWLMQNLLTGKKRLKGFDGDWQQVKLRELFTEIKNVNDGGDSHSVMTISSKQGLISQEDKFDRVIAGDSLKKYTQLKKGDFAYNKGNSKTYQMGCIYQLEEKESALVPFVYICFSPTEMIDSKFYKHWFFAHGLDRQLKKIISSGARGDGLLNVNTDDFFNLKVPFPSKEEQTAIAEVLQATDKELQLLKAKTDKLKEQKKGLMQVLLTGKKRLKVT
jgi:type I restriction enzyme S subunit